MGCCPSNQLSLPPAYLVRRNSKSGRYNERTRTHEQKEQVRRLALEKTQPDIEMMSETIAKHNLLYRLGKSQRQKMVSHLEAYECDENTTIFKKGDIASLFFIIRSGEVEIKLKEKKKKEEEVKILSRGNFFGDLALIFAAPRSATVRAVSACTFFCISNILFRRVVQDIVKKNYEQSKLSIEKIPLFKFLTKREKNSIAYNTLLMKFEKGQTIFEKGDDANCLYIIKSGRIQLKIDGKPTLRMSADQSFGQNAFEENPLRSGTAIAMEKSHLLAISRECLQRCLGHQLKQISFYNILKWGLSRDDLFGRSNKIQIQKLISSCQIRKYKNDEVICEAGSLSMFIVIVLEEKINEYEVGSIINTEYLFADTQDERKLTTTLKKVGTGHVAIVHFDDLTRIFGRNLSELELARPSRTFIVDLSHKRNQFLQNVGLDDFKLKGLIGSGDFGKFYLVEGQFEKKYAIKCIQKRRVVENSMEKFVINERDILQGIRHPLLIKLYKTFQDNYFIYFLTNFIEGVDFFDWIRQIGLCDRKRGQFYAGCLILALEHLHEKSIIFRDIKPESIVVDEAGYLHLVDFGIAKLLSEQNGYRTFTIIGTPHYLAPEIVGMEGYSFSADIWSLGVVIYEMICGTLPYGNDLEDPYQIFKQIDSRDVQFPDFYTDKDGKILMSKLLSKNPNKREVEEYSKIKNLAFFDNMDWEQLGQKGIKAPLKVKPKKLMKAMDEPFTEYIMKETEFLLKAKKSEILPDWDSSF